MLASFSAEWLLVNIGMGRLEKMNSASMWSYQEHFLTRVITYGTFDTLHFGHIRLLHRAKALGDFLIVGLSTDVFNATKGKQSHFSFAERKMYLEAIRYVDLVIPEDSWDQKARDIAEHRIDIFTMGSDWAGHFDDLGALCTVHYLERTPEISSTLIKANISTPDTRSA